jgi:hypothetical protein
MQKHIMKSQKFSFVRILIFPWGDMHRGLVGVSVVLRMHITGVKHRQSNQICNKN